MRGNDFLDKMELVDPAYVEAADTEPKKRRTVWIRWGMAAACFAILLYAGVRLFSHKAPDLPMLCVSEDAAGAVAMGFEGYMAYDISELVDANPWNEALGLSTLPVYQNPQYNDADNMAVGSDLSQQREFLLEVARRFGFDANEVIITDNAPDEETKQRIIEKLQAVGETVPEGYFNPTAPIIQADGLEIEVDRSMTAKISFEPAVSLPGEYHFTHDATYDDLAAVAGYLKNEYQAFIGMENPQVNIYGGDYNIYAQQMYSVAFFDAGGDEIEQIINYNFNRVMFYCNDEGKLFLARIYQPDLSVKIGDYPIISPEQAGELLAEGNYLTTVPYEMPGRDYVKKVELIYRTGEQEEYYMPYYRFYVELPEAGLKNGLKTYGAYYVPAVEGSYISNMPTRDGSVY